MTATAQLDAARQAGKAAAQARKPFTANPYADREGHSALALARAWRIGYGQGNPMRRRPIPREDLD